MKLSWRLYGDKASILTCDDPERFYLRVWYILFEDLGHLKIKLNEAWMVFPPPFAVGVGSSDGIWWDWISNCHWRCSAIIFIIDYTYLSFLFDILAFRRIVCCMKIFQYPHKLFMKTKVSLNFKRTLLWKNIDTSWMWPDFRTKKSFELNIYWHYNRHWKLCFYSRDIEKPFCWKGQCFKVESKAAKCEAR